MRACVRARVFLSTSCEVNTCTRFWLLIPSHKRFVCPRYQVACISNNLNKAFSNLYDSRVKLCLLNKRQICSNK